ncbi:MAG: YceI family protein [Bacteroidia bacterium]
MKRFFIIAPLLIALISLLAYTDSPYINFPDKAPGKLSFIGNAGSDQVFSVERWKFSKVENANDPENIQIQAELDISSLACSWDDLLQSVKKKKDYFNVSKFKVASVSIEGAKANDDGSYTADAMLSLKGVTKKVPVNFTISDEAPYHIEASAVVKRKKFGFNGGGPKNEVPVTISADLVVGE